MAIIWEDDIDKKLSFRIESLQNQGNILTVFDKKSGETQATTEVYVSDARIAASDEEVRMWKSIAASIVPSK